MFKLLMALLLLLPVGAFSNPGKVFPTPPGFTTDIQKEWTIAYNVPRYLIRMFGKEGRLPLGVRPLDICNNIFQQYEKNRGKRNLTARLEEGTVYTLYTFGVGNAGESFKRNSSEVQHKISCTFYWSVNNIISKESPSYFIEKR